MTIFISNELGSNEKKFNHDKIIDFGFFIEYKILSWGWWS